MAPTTSPFASKPFRVSLVISFCLVTMIIIIILINNLLNMLKGILQFPKEPLDDCSIGFELTPSYATAAFSCERGTEPTLSGPILLVEGNKTYRDAMFHLSTDPGYLVGEDEIEKISIMFSELVDTSEQRVHSYILSATLGYPSIPALLANDTGKNIMRKAFANSRRALEYEQVLDSSREDTDIHASHSVLAGHGLGLCQPWQTEEDSDCEKHQNLPADTYLLAAYYSYGIELVITEETTSVYDVRSYTYNNYSLGYKSRPSGFPQLAYWDDVRGFLRTALLQHPELKPRTLILYGDRSTDEIFQAVLDQVLDQVLGPEDRPHRLLDGVDPTFAGAIGAAEMLKRKKYKRRLRWNEKWNIDLR